ncbi:hypothetical protein BGW38_005272 [Lunasporangiospora selenospora]|uniref:FAD-binding domain-containing protein n=1 Tax=Lunasporangiospora selenospora TaxID=979761 RepID=A0A9P6KBH4_9FUNG|nr:hypothetical protein BGW38_005272 [Lunasporangiospora selenospora]
MSDTPALPQVLIVGAGLSSLFLALLLDRIDVPYQIFERAATVKPLGAVMTLSAHIMPAFEQLGLYEDLQKISIPTKAFHVYNSDIKKIGMLDGAKEKELVGYDRLLFARPLLYDLLLSKIPKERIHFSKKVASTRQDDKQVTIECEDGTSYTGDMLVGADGAYSVVRQSLYKELAEKGTLSQNDSQSLEKGYICLVGTTDPLDLEKYPGLDRPEADSSLVVGKGIPYAWTTFTMPENRICWNVILQLREDASKSVKSLKNAEWGAEANEAMIKEVYEFKTPWGIIGKLIDATPRDRISKVYLEDKLFETWNGGRTVLIGDACHKMLPSAGMGAVNAMEDSVILANCIYELTDLSVESIDAACKDFRDQRYPHVVQQYIASRVTGIIEFGHAWWERLFRHVLFNYLPTWIQLRSVVKDSAYRPQATFLPLAKKRGIVDVIPQKPSKRNAREQQEIDPVTL